MVGCACFWDWNMVTHTLLEFLSQINLLTESVSGSWAWSINLLLPVQKLYETSLEMERKSVLRECSALYPTTVYSSSSSDSLQTNSLKPVTRWDSSSSKHSIYSYSSFRIDECVLISLYEGTLFLKGICVHRDSYTHVHVWRTKNLRENKQWILLGRDHLMVLNFHQILLQLHEDFKNVSQ